MMERGDGGLMGQKRQFWRDVTIEQPLFVEISAVTLGGKHTKSTGKCSWISQIRNDKENEFM